MICRKRHQRKFKWAYEDIEVSTRVFKELRFSRSSRKWSLKEAFQYSRHNEQLRRKLIQFILLIILSVFWYLLLLFRINTGPCYRLFDSTNKLTGSHECSTLSLLPTVIFNRWMNENQKGKALRYNINWMKTNTHTLRLQKYFSCKLKYLF